jgi:hypothetical protein
MYILHQFGINVRFNFTYQLMELLPLRGGKHPNGGAMAKAVSRRHFTSEVLVYNRSVHVGCVVDKGFLRVLLFSPVSIIPPWISTLI